MKHGLILVLSGLAFFFNPCISMFDFLPDFLGCILISLGLSRLSKIDENLESAKKCASYYAWVSLLKLALSVWTIMGHTDYLMPFTFSFGVLDIIFMLAFFRNLYTGIDYFAMRNDCENLREPASNAFSMSVIFVVVTRVLDFAPHITDLFKQRDEIDLSYDAYRKVSLAVVKPSIMAACMMLGLILGIIYICITTGFFRKVISNRTFIKKADEKYTADILSNRELYVSLILPGVYTFMYVGLFFILDFSIDATNVIPTFISPVLFIIAAYRLKLLDKELKPPVIAAFVCFVSSIANYFYTAKVNLGTSYLMGTYTQNKSEFLFLNSGASIAIQFLLSAVQCISMIVMLFALYNGMNKVFGSNLRSAGMRKLVFCKINTVVLCCTSFIYSLVKTTAAHLATYDKVNAFIMHRGMLKESNGLAANLKELDSWLSNPLVKTFDILDSLSLIVFAIFFIATVWNIMYLSKVSLATEGSKN